MGHSIVNVVFLYECGNIPLDVLDAYLEFLIEEPTMRTTFTITLHADVKEYDHAAQDAFKELLRDNAETLYAQCSIVSRRPPTITVTVQDETQGTVRVPLFGEVVHEEDYSGS